MERKLPVDPTGVVPSELDIRLDNRYIDLRRKESTLIFKTKSVAVNGFPGETARAGIPGDPPFGHHRGRDPRAARTYSQLQYFENNAYLVQSPQLYKQMSVIGGLDRVYDDRASVPGGEA